jgi:thymidylate kinase
MSQNSSIIVSFMGVDGSGKSTLIELLRKKLKNKFRKIKYIHLRPYLILLDKSTSAI